MFIDEPLPFIKTFVDALDSKIQEYDPQSKLSWCQKRGLSFCCMGIAVTNSICWSQFSRCRLGKHTENALCWMFCHSKINWDSLLISSVRVILAHYGIQEGSLELDDSDRQRSKSTKRVFGVHKIKDKKTGGYFMGQSILMLLLVTPTITFPVGFAFYRPDPVCSQWAAKDKELRKKKVAKKKRPPKPDKNPQYPNKSELALTLLDQFETHFPQVKVLCICADALYGGHFFFKHAPKKFGGVQVISPLKCTQMVSYRGKKRSLKELFCILPPVSHPIQIRGEKKQVAMIGSVRVPLKAHGCKRFVIALKYEGETEYRYLVASDLSWRTQDSVQAYTLRWLVEVFFQDWKSYEGWGQLAKQFDEDGSSRGLILSLLLDHCLFFHPDQLSCLENKLPAYTVGSLLEKIKAQSLMQFIQSLYQSETEIVKKLAENITKIFKLRHSKKHMANRNLGKMKATYSLRYRVEKTPLLKKAA